MRRPVNPQKGRSVAKRGAFRRRTSSANRSPAPHPPRSGLHHRFYSPSAGISHRRVTACTARRRGVPFAPPKGTKSGSRGTDSPLTNPFPAPCCAGYERRFSVKKPSVLHADGLNKVSVTHLPPPGLPRFGGGERPPFLCKLPAPLTITMGRRLIFRPIIVPHPNHRDPPPLQALTPRECYSRFLVASPSGPLSRLGKGGGGKGQMLPQATLGAILCAVRIDFGFCRKSIRIQHSQRQGSWGSAPSVFC